MTCSFSLHRTPEGNFYHCCECGYSPYHNGVTDQSELVAMINAHIYRTRYHIWLPPPPF